MPAAPPNSPSRPSAAPRPGETPTGAPPSRRTLLAAWLALIAFTLATMLAGRVTERAPLGAALLAALLTVTWLKATWILRYYLDLRRASRAWNQAFSGLILLLLAAIFAISLSVPLLST